MMKKIKTILIVDDDNLLSEAIQGLMEVQGHVVTCCGYSLEAVTLSEEHDYDIILIDYNMPVIKGDLVCRLIRHTRPEAYIVGMSTEAKEKDFINAGANKFLDKTLLVQDFSLLHDLIQAAS